MPRPRPSNVIDFNERKRQRDEDLAGVLDKHRFARRSRKK